MTKTIDSKFDVENAINGALLTLQEHKLMGSTFPAYAGRNPYTPLAVLDGKLSIEECFRLRKDNHSFALGIHYNKLPRTFIPITLESLDIDPRSSTYGQTTRDPSLIIETENGDSQVSDIFPFIRNKSA